PWSRFASTSQWYTTLLGAVAEKHGFSLDTPWKDLSDEARDVVLHGSGVAVTFYYRNRQGVRRQYSSNFEGVVPNLERRYKDASEHGREEIEQYMSARPCPACKGARLKPESLSVTIGSRNIVQVGDFSIVNALRYFEALTADAGESNGAYRTNGTNGTNGNGGNGKANGRVNLRLLKAL